MTIDPQALTITIYNHEFQVKCPLDKQRELHECARYIDTKMREVAANGKSIGLERIAITTLLNVTHEQLQQQKQKDLYIDALSGRIRELEHKLEMLLAQSPTPEL